MPVYATTLQGWALPAGDPGTQPKAGSSAYRDSDGARCTPTAAATLSPLSGRWSCRCFCPPACRQRTGVARQPAALPPRPAKAGRMHRRRIAPPKKRPAAAPAGDRTDPAVQALIIQALMLQAPVLTAGKACRKARTRHRLNSRRPCHASRRGPVRRSHPVHPPLPSHRHPLRKLPANRPRRRPVRPPLPSRQPPRPWCSTGCR